jgi:glycosyltransferase involved in cell wall biosynthesis
VQLFLMHADVFSRAAEFDLIHTHTDYLAFPYASHSPAPVVTTLHGRLDTPHFADILCRFPDVHLVFLGRMTPEKAPHAAIEIAEAAGVPFTLAGRVEPTAREYFEREVEPRPKHRLLRYVGEVNDAGRQTLLGSALALLFPIDWPEPFGLVMIEAMACGTPVIARPKGAASEVVENGVNGILADDEERLVQAVKDVRDVDRAACRRDVEQRFSVAAMAEDYERVYEELLAQRRRSRKRRTK